MFVQMNKQNHLNLVHVNLCMSTHNYKTVKPEAENKAWTYSIGGKLN